MRFCEYDSSSKPCVEYTLSLAEENYNDDGRDKQQKLIWSKTKQPTSTFKQSANASSYDSLGYINTITAQIKQLGRDLFLPIGYPQSVNEGYLKYQYYDSLQGLCSYLRGVVSTSAVLSATGVGDAQATAMSAAMTWAVRDGLGMIGGLLFSYICSSHFDAHVKEFRLLADVLNDIGMTIDMALPFLLSQTWMTFPLTTSYPAISEYLPSSYLILTSTSTLCKVACGMAAGATKGNITDHFAICGNRADCQAKESTQETLVSIVGMCMGVWMAGFIHRLEKNQDDDTTCSSGELDDTCSNNANTITLDAQVISWGIFISLTLLHVWANYIGMQCLRLRTLNQQRAKIALQPLIEECGQSVLSICNDSHGSSAKKTTTNPLITKTSSYILSPNDVNESLWKSICSMLYQGNILLGISLKNLIRMTNSRQNNLVQGNWHSEKYMIFIDGDVKDNKAHKIIVLLRVGANDNDELKAFVHAHIVNWCLLQHESCESTKHSQLLSR